MSISLALDRAKTLKRVLPVLAVATVVLLAAGMLYASALKASAAAPADFGLREGDVISASGSDDPDVYIVNQVGYKRLFLNPVIFSFYGHLGGFGAVKSVAPSTRDAFMTSGLFRNCETNSQTVWAVEVTGEDTGVFHHVQMTGGDAVAQDPNFFNKVFCINTREEAWYPKSSTPYTSLAQVPVYSRTGTTTSPVVTGNLMVSLAPNTPTAATITKNALQVTYTTLRFTGTGTVQNITVSRGGAGATADFSNVYIYDGTNRLTSAKSLSSSTGKVTFVGLNVPVNGTKDLSVVADMSGTGGDVNNLGVLSAGDVVISGGTVGGSFPIVGANMTLSGSNGGTYDIAKTGSVSNPNVGAKGIKLSEFQITVNTEGGWVKRIRMIQGGTIKDSDITNIKIQSNSSDVGTGYMSNGYLVVDLGAGVKIEKGNTKTFSVYADVGGKKDETIKLYFETAGDVFVMGDQFGFGMAGGSTGITPLDTTSEAHSLTLQGGVITLTFNGPTATNIADKAQDAVLLRFSINAAKSLELKKHTVVLCADIAGDGTYDTLDTNFSDLEDIKIKDMATGTVLVGPADGSAFTTAETTASCPGAFVGLYKTFTDTFEVQSGQTLDLAITADVKTANSSDSSTALSNSSIIKAIIDGYGDGVTGVGSSGDLTVARYSGTNTAVTSADFSPSTDMSGNNMTINTSSVTLGLSSDPQSKTYVKGTSNVDLVGFTLRTALGSGVKVSDVTLTGYISDDASTFAKSKSLSDADSTMSVANLISTVKLVDGDTGTQVCSLSSNNLNTTTSTIVFNNCNWQIPAGATKRLLVRGDISSNATSGSSDAVSFDVAATTDITGVDDSGTSVNATGSAINGGTSPTIKMTVASSGSMTASLSPSSPTTESKYWGQTGSEFSRFRLTATNDAFLVERFTVIASGSGESSNVIANVKQVSLTYTNKLGNLITQTGTPGSSGSVAFSFAGDNRPYIPKDSSADIIVKTDMKTKTEGATNNVNFSLDMSDTFNGSTADGFRAIGEGSSQVIDGSSTGIADVVGNNMYVYRVFPKFDQVAISTGEPLGTKDVLKFTVTAMGLPDSKLFFDNTATGSGSIKFEVVASGDSAATNLTATTYDVSDGAIVSQDTITSAGDSPSYYASLTLDFGSPGKDVEITGGQSKTFRVEVGFTGFNDKSDFFQLILRDNEAGLINWVANSTGSAADADTASTTTTLRLLPMNGPTFSKL